MTNEIRLRAVEESDLPTFFEHQLDPDATRMAAFPARDRAAFMAHWGKIMLAGTATLKTILFRGEVAGNIVAWEDYGKLKVGYWLGKDYWGKGIASEALSQFLVQVKARPLYAHVAKQNIASVRVLQKCGFTISGEDKFAGVDGQEGQEFVMRLAANDQGSKE